LKVRLGLSPQTPIVLDKVGLAGFRETFKEVDRWSGNPGRDMTDLPRIAAHLPQLGDVVIDGHSIKDLIFTQQERPEEHLEDLLSAAVRLARTNKNRGGRAEGGDRKPDDTGLELKLRSALRRLLRIVVAYEIERRRFVLVIRQRDQAQERLLAPQRVTPPRIEDAPKEGAGLIAELIGAQERMRENQDRLVALWTEYQSLRLAMFRDLGTLPCDDWESFYDQLTARPRP
jgi:hypothetical protein